MELIVLCPYIYFNYNHGQYLNYICTRKRLNGSSERSYLKVNVFRVHGTKVRDRIKAILL